MDPYQEATLAAGPSVQRSPIGTGPLGHADEAEPAAGAATGPATGVVCRPTSPPAPAVVGDLELDGIGRVAHAHIRLRILAGVLAHIGQGLLSDPVQIEGEHRG